MGVILRRMALVSFLLWLLVFEAPAPAPASAAPVAGVQLHPLWAGVDGAGIERQLDAAAGVGAGIVRVDVGWASLEQDGKGIWATWYLQRLDRVVAGARRRGLRLLLTVTSSPCWASSAPARLAQGCAGAWWERGVQNYAPRDPADYADALAFLVRRYGSRVAAWEVWNEPNQADYFSAPDPARAYAALLRHAYRAVKVVDPHAVVVGGSLSEADAAFTRRLYRLGVKGHFDAWSVHPYSGDRSPLSSSPRGARYAFAAGVSAVRRVMLAHRDPKPIWLTEFGWSTADVRGQAPWANGVDQGTQARFLAQAFHQVRSWRFVPVAIWYDMTDTSGNPADRVGNYGLLSLQGTPKPALAEFRRAAAALSRQ